MSQARESMYKNRYKSRYKDAESRLKGKAMESRKQRQELFTSRRKAVLDEINEDIVAEEESKVIEVKKNKTRDRRADLMKWKKERDERKQKEQSRAKPIFKVTRVSPSIYKDTPPKGKHHAPPPKDVTSKKCGKVGASKETRRIATRSDGKGQERPASTRETRQVKKNRKPSPNPSTSSKGSIRTVKESTKSHDYHMTDDKDIPDDRVFSSAWIPGAPPTPQTKTGKPALVTFDDFFTKQSFSPFQFKGRGGDTTAEDKHLFTFRKELPIINQEENREEIMEDEREDVLEDLQPEESDEMGPLPSNKGMSDISIEAINVSVAHNNEYTNKQLEGEGLISATPKIKSTDDPHNKSPTLPSHGATPTNYDLKPFFQLHSDVTDRFNELCTEWNEKLSKLEKEDTGRPSEDVMDDIRTTICQAKLLMRQKLKQYLDLVKQVEDPMCERKPLAEDLKGFWDMVYYQVDSIDQKFMSFAEMESNNWTLAGQVSVKPQQSRHAKRRRSTKAKSSSVVTERMKRARAKREAERSKLREMKLAAAAKAKQEKEHLATTPIDDTTSDRALGSDLESPSVSHQSLDTPQPMVSMKKKRRQTEQVVDDDEEDGAFLLKIVQVNASKRKIKDLKTDMIMSPARRSKRLASRQSLRKELVLDSIDDIPSKGIYQSNDSLK